MRYFIHRTYVLFLVNQGSTYSYSLAIIINIKTVPLSHSKTNSLTCTTKVLSTVHTTGEQVFIVCSNNSRAVLKAVYGFNPTGMLRRKIFGGYVMRGKTIWRPYNARNRLGGRGPAQDPAGRAYSVPADTLADGELLTAPFKEPHPRSRPFTPSLTPRPNFQSPPN